MNSPPILVYFSGDWDVHWGYGLLTHGHILHAPKGTRWVVCTPPCSHPSKGGAAPRGDFYQVRQLGAFLPVFGWEGSPTKIDYRKKGTLILSSLLKNLVYLKKALTFVGGSI